MANQASKSADAVSDNQRGQWSERTPSELVALILERFHQPLRRDLPALLASARAVEEAHCRHASCPTGLVALLEEILRSVESHLEKEEKILFPLITAGRGGLAFMPVKVMMAEHQDHLANLQRIADITRRFALPADAGADWRALFDGLSRLDRDLREHIDLENDVLFPRVLGGDTGAG